MTVFRPRRRCPQCGLVNSDNAKKCRRCARSLEDIDPALASELMVARMKAKRLALIAILVLIVGGGIAAFVAYRAKLERLAAFTERVRSVETDVAALKRGAVDDAAAIGKAFDDKEVKALLKQQSPTWASRVDQCKGLGDQLDELVPQNEEQTTRELALETDVDRVKQAASALIAAADTGDVFAARVAAENLTKGQGASK